MSKSISKNLRKRRSFILRQGEKNAINHKKELIGSSRYVVI